MPEEKRSDRRHTAILEEKTQLLVVKFARRLAAQDEVNEDIIEILKVLSKFTQSKLPDLFSKIIKRIIMASLIWFILIAFTTVVIHAFVFYFMKTVDIENLKQVGFGIAAGSAGGYSFFTAFRKYILESNDPKKKGAKHGT